MGKYYIGPASLPSNVNRLALVPTTALTVTTTKDWLLSVVAVMGHTFDAVCPELTQQQSGACVACVLESQTTVPELTGAQSSLRAVENGVPA